MKLQKRHLIFIWLSSVAICFGGESTFHQSPKPNLANAPKNNRGIVPQRIASYKINTLLGLNITKGTAVVSGFQLGKAISRRTPFYLVGEANFSLFSPGSILAILAGGWYEFSPFSNPRQSIVLGAVAGPGFSTQLKDFKPTFLVGLFDAAFVLELDDLAKMRFQLRPGIMGDHFAFMVNLNVSFSPS